MLTVAFIKFHSLPDCSIYSVICSAMLPVVILNYFEPQTIVLLKVKYIFLMFPEMLISMSETLN